MCEPTYVCFSLKAVYKLSLSVGKTVRLLFSWNILGWKFVSVFAEKYGCIFSSFLVAQLVASQTNSAHHLDWLWMFWNNGLVLSFHCKKTLESVPFDRLVMTGIKTGISRTEGMGWRTKLCLSRQNWSFCCFAVCQVDYWASVVTHM